MTLDEKVRQLVTNQEPAIPRLKVPEYHLWNEALHGVNSLGENVRGGPGTNGVHATGFPTNLAAAAAWDPDLTYGTGSAISDEARGFLDKSLWNVSQNNIGPDQNQQGSLNYFAPTINMARNAKWGREDEGFGEDPLLTGTLATQWIAGFQGENPDGTPINGYLKASATAKHYALNNVENGRTSISSDVSESELRDYYTQQFSDVIANAHPAGVMSSYNAINDTPAVANTHTLDELARKTYGHTGFVTSDCGGVGTTSGGHNWVPPGSGFTISGQNWVNSSTGTKLPATAGGQAYALRAGNDVNCSGDEMTTQNIEAAIGAGILSEGVLDTALVRVFTMRMKTGEFDPPSSDPWTSLTKAQIQSPAHVALAGKSADESMVLLKNDPVAGKPLLPASLPDKVVVLGNLAGVVNLGSYGNNPTQQVSMAQGITNRVKAANPNASVVVDAAGTSTTATTDAVLSTATTDAIKAAKLVVLVVGTDHDTASEGRDRTTLALPGNQNSLIDKVTALGNPNVVLDIQSVGAVDISARLPKLPAVLYSSYNGQLQGDALADVLFGAQNPQGRLPITWYTGDSQLAAPDDYGLTPSESGGLGQTYQYLTVKPQFPFGYGLSYTTFTYSPIRADQSSITADGTVTVSFDVTNSGSVAGSTVAQIYAAPQFTVSGVELPKTRLVAFKNTGVLQPGATQHVTLAIKAAGLSRWDNTTSREKVDNGAYALRLGTDAATTSSSTTVTVTGTLTPKVKTVTVNPGQIVANAGDKIDLRGNNPWLADDTDPAKEHRTVQPAADDIVTATATDESFVDLSKTAATYASSNPDVATVDTNGVVTARNDGVTTIKVTVGGVSGTTPLVVQNKLRLTADPLLKAGTAGTATTKFVNATTSPITNLTVGLTLPAGWTADATTATTSASLSPGATLTTTWRVTAPAGTGPGSFTASASATYDGGAADDSQTLNIPYADLASAATTIGTTDDANTAPGKFDGGGNSYSAQALAAAGITPGGKVPFDVVTFTWPSAAPGTKNVVDSRGQAISITGRGTKLAFLGAASSGKTSGTGTIVYTDGSTQPYGIDFTDWFADTTKPGVGNTTVKNLPYLNQSNGTHQQHAVGLYATTVALHADKTVAAVILPNVEVDGNSRIGMNHLFAVAIGGNPPISTPAPAGKSGQLVGYEGLCADLSSAATIDTSLVLNKCDGAATQQFTLGTNGTLWNGGFCVDGGGDIMTRPVLLANCDGSDREKFTVGANGNLVNVAAPSCLSDDHKVLTDGSAVQMYPCNGGDSGQQWMVPDGTTPGTKAQPAGPAGPITGVGGMCVGVTGDIATDGAALALQNCNAAKPTQKFVPAADKSLWVAGKCATLWNGFVANGARVTLDTCDGSTSQQWTVNSFGGLVNGKSATCLLTPGNSTTDGTELQVYPCNSGATGQHWTLPATTATTTPSGWNTVTSKSSGKCVTARTGTDGTAVQQVACNSTTAQQWQFQSLGNGVDRVNSRLDTTRSWDVLDRSTADAAPIQLWVATSTPGTNQQWTPVFETTNTYHFINKNSGKCLEVPGGSTADNVQLQQRTCDGSTRQSFSLTAVA
ncbi:ricin-type beta-trefoil lectin domain protein [Actinoplanes sp. TBRC 11911]|uniref:ricin-type beta-trefoil lectin domain protein n=1 Tax=Actinoplanes sp. TBRC 11911 TaxID=2729386 RepID=UPI001B7D5B3E|nr:ricin-type beta-trefoil lectin domain protein [Actinoplanes sp. TBRC 11911]